MRCRPTTQWIGTVLSGVVAFLAAAYVAMSGAALDGPQDGASIPVSRSTVPTLSTDALRTAPKPHLAAEQRILPGSPEDSLDLRTGTPPDSTPGHWAIRQHPTSR